MEKPHVLVTVLCGTERANWINPRLNIALVIMSHDTRFRVETRYCVDAKPIDYARNKNIAEARERGADWLVQIDNDIFTKTNPLDVIAQARPEHEIIGLSAGIPWSFYPHAPFEEGYKLATESLTGWPVGPMDFPAGAGDFLGVDKIGAGGLMTRFFFSLKEMRL